MFAFDPKFIQHRSTVVTKEMWGHQSEDLTFKSWQWTTCNDTQFLTEKNYDLPHCYFLCMLPSTHCSCHWDHSDTTGSHSVCPSPCTKWIHQMVANLQAWTKFITWQGPQVGKCFSEYYFLTGSSSRHDELNQLWRQLFMFFF